MEYKIPLFSWKAKYVGLLLCAIACLSGWFYFWGGKPDFFQIRVFALVSQYLEKRYFLFIQTNVLDEIAAIFMILGLAAISFSSEKQEEPIFNSIRYEALFKALVLGVIFWVLSFLLVYGLAIFPVLSVGLIFYLVCYIIIFRIRVYQVRRNQLSSILVAENAG